VDRQVPDSECKGLLLVADLMFASQVQGLVRSCNITLQWVRSVEQALERATADAPACLVFDVNLVGEGIDDLVAKLRANPRPPVLIGFGAHVDAASLQRARQAGCKIVLPRSKFVQEVGRCLPQWLQD